MKISKLHARLFLLEYQKLLNCKCLEGKEGIMCFLKKVGSIQFDPLSIIDINPNLVLQARIKDYKSEYLTELLYKDRQLVDDWDKCMCIYAVEDWPYFQKFRERLNRDYSKNSVSPEIFAEIRKTIQEKGPISSGDLDYKEKVNWFWNDSNIGKVALESMYYNGKLIVHHKEGIRKYYDFTKNCLPKNIAEMKDPNQEIEQFFQWIVNRRIGSVGLLWNRRSDAFQGISFMRSKERNEAIKELVKKNKLIEVFVEDIAYPFYLRRSDLYILEKIIKGINYVNKVSFIAPLDNLIWDRELIKQLFNFEYTWEVYKPASLRIYGYYVLPVLFGDKFIARFEPRYDKKKKVLSILNWWYEDGVVVTKEMITKIHEAINEFKTYLNANEIKWLCSIE